MKIVCLLSITLLLACKEKEATTQQATPQHVWFKKPAQIEAQLQQWGIIISEADKELYFSTLGMLYGATNIETQEVLVQDSPVVTYVMALNVVSDWLSRILVEKQVELEENKSSVFMFKGAGIPAATGVCNKSDSSYCFAEHSKDTWCDCDDELSIGRYRLGAAPPDPTSTAERKRIMHNMQDMGEFLGITLDNCSPSPDKGKYQHLPHYLLDTVFLPAFKNPPLVEGTIVSKKHNEIYAWRKVIHAMLLSGEFFMNLDPRRKAICQ